MTRYTDECKAEIIDHLVAQLETGLYSCLQICRAFDPPLPPQTLRDWRKADALLGQRIDNAFELGSDNLAIRMRRTAQGKTEEQGGDSTGSVERDKLVLWWDEKLISRWNTRYQAKQIISNDPQHPMPAPQFIIQPVAPKE